MSRNWRAAVGLGATLVLLACAVVATSAWVSADRSPRVATGRAGGIHLAAGHLDPPDGDWVQRRTRTALVAWLQNEGDSEVVLRSVTSPLARSVEVTGTDLPLTIPPQRWAVFGAQGRGLHLRGLVRPVLPGDTVPVTFRFAGASLTARLPVVGTDSATPAPATTAPSGTATPGAGKGPGTAAEPTTKTQKTQKKDQKKDQKKQ